MALTGKCVRLESLISELKDNMTIQQAIQEIKSVNKAYLQIEKPMTQAYFSDMCVRAELGRLKPDTLRSFLERFGYSLDIELKAEKK